MFWTRINVPGCDLNVPEASKQRFYVLDDENFEASWRHLHPSRTAEKQKVDFAYRGEIRRNLRYFQASRTAKSPNLAIAHEAKVIKLIVERISLELRTINTVVDENLIGMEPRMQALDPYLEIGSDDVRMIGIKGMGGAGKTTLARAIFDKISIHFEGKSFVENVREISKAPFLDLKKLQKQVLTDVLKDKCISVSSVHEGTNLMKTMLCGKKVLIVLDDVDHIDQLEALAGDPRWFKLGSRIIITTRDQQVLIAHRVGFIQDVHLLSDEEAIHLFSRHAFREAFPTHEYETHSLDQVVRYAAGLPLTIKVLGSHLCGKSELEWTDALSRLKTIPLKQTIEKLEISYDSLEDDYKEIFLDVACFCRYMEKDDAIRMLESCGYHARNGLKVLQQKSLITFNRRNWIMMHDHIVEMGKNIVRRDHLDEPHKHSRLWVQEEIEHLLAKNLGTEATRCIYLKITRGIVLESLEKMKKLRCLIINSGYYNLSDYSVKIDEACQCFLNSLQYLNWMHYPHWCLPKTFEANNLVTLEMTRSKIEQLWNEGRCGLPQKSHRKVDQFESLEKLDLSGYHNFRDMPSNICELKHLKDLYLSGCMRFDKLPDDLEGLKIHRSDVKYQVSEYDDFIRLCFTREPQIQEFKKLRILVLVRCGIEEVPEALGHLEVLEELHLRHCFCLEKLPEGIGQVESLEELYITRCYNIRQIPGSICLLKNLKKLELEGCRRLEMPSRELEDYIFGILA
ncbi:hypothetical protein E3N88_19325 [Mikania micrantha]|uniref:Uncharacterized protein n=1 Tax=Mikania micrantha TaxID=192012 RepID=A0A5N6NP81_9ASTR|nr:hypothetical protein E3N88_19325 [Mikania micrantha]